MINTTNRDIQNLQEEKENTFVKHRIIGKTTNNKIQQYKQTHAKKEYDTGKDNEIKTASFTKGIKKTEYIQVEIETRAFVIPQTK